jgi:hypothetical protein
MRLTELQAELARLLAFFVLEVKANGALSHTDISDASATLFLEVFRELFDLPGLRDLNAEKANFPGIDLGDDIKGRAFQVTADGRLAKILKTLKVSIDSKVHEKYPLIQVYVTTEKQRSYSQKSINKKTKGEIKFDGKKDILDSTDLLKLFRYLSPEKAEKIVRIVREHVRVPTAAIPTLEVAQLFERDVAARFQVAIARAAFPEAQSPDDIAALAEQLLLEGTKALSIHKHGRSTSIG